MAYQCIVSPHRVEGAHITIQLPSGTFVHVTDLQDIDPPGYRVGIRHAEAIVQRDNIAWITPPTACEGRALFSDITRKYYAAV